MNKQINIIDQHLEIIKETSELHLTKHEEKCIIKIKEGKREITFSLDELDLEVLKYFLKKDVTCL